MTFPITPKNLIGLSAVLLMLAVVFGVLNTQKLKSLRTSAFNAVTSVDNSEQERESKACEASLTDKFSEMEGKTAKTEAELARIQVDKANLQSKLQANEGQIAALHRQIDEASAKPSANPGAPSTIELQAQLEDEKKQRDAAAKKTGIRGTILAVNQAYNFVVLNLGGRQGVELNAEMIVMRDGTLIGKIRVSSVEPFTTIGDIIPRSLARGVQVQPGDTVIYAGNF
jgi:cell shape-determining protein MreC